MGEESHRGQRLAHRHRQWKAALPQPQIGGDAAPPECHRHDIHPAVGCLQQKVVVHGDQSQAAESEQRLAGKLPQNRAPGAERQQPPEQREQSHGKDAEPEDAKPRGVEQQVQRHHPIRVTVDARQLHALPRAAGGVQDGGAHEPPVGEVIGGTPEPALVAPGSPREHIGEPQSEVHHDDQGQSED